MGKPRAWTALLAVPALLVAQGCSSPPGTERDGGADGDTVHEDSRDAPLEDIPLDPGREDLPRDVPADEEAGEEGSDIEEPEELEEDLVELPASCAPWAGLYDLELLEALHAHLHDAYEPIEAMENEAGVPDRYVTARFLMFTGVEWVLSHERGRDGIECIYTGAFLATAEGEEPHHTVMNCEHTWPRSAMDPDRDSLLFSHQESDIHALYAALPAVNSARGSFPFGEPVSDLDIFENPDDPDIFAAAGLSADGERVFQPREERRGDVARAMFYFSVRWGKEIEEAEELVLRAWFDEDPVDERERERNELIEEMQGSRNPFVDCPELAGMIDDFTAFEILDTNESLPPP